MLLLLLAAGLAGLLWLIWPGQRELGGQPAAALPLSVSGANAVAADLEQDAEPERSVLVGPAQVQLPPVDLLASMPAPLATDWLALPCSGFAQRSGAPMGGRFRFSGRLVQPDDLPLKPNAAVRVCLSYAKLSPSLGITASHVRFATLKTGIGGAFAVSLDAGSAPGRCNAYLEFWYAGLGLDTPWSARIAVPDPTVGGDFDLGAVRLWPAPILVSGRVVDGQGQPLEGVSVSIRSATEFDEDGRDPRPSPALADPRAAWPRGQEVKRLQAANTNAKGEFRLRGELSSPLFLVGAKHRLAESAVWARPGERELLLRLDLPQTLSGVVRLAPGVATPQQIYVLLSEQLEARDVGSHFEEHPGTIREALLSLPRAADLPAGELRGIKLHFETQSDPTRAAPAGAQAHGTQEFKFLEFSGFPGLVQALLGSARQDPQVRVLVAMGYEGNRSVLSDHTWNQNSAWGPAVTEFAFDFGKRDDREYRLELIGVCLQGPPEAPKFSYLHKTLWIQHDSSVSEPAWRSELVLK